MKNRFLFMGMMAAFAIAAVSASTGIASTANDSAFNTKKATVTLHQNDVAIDAQNAPAIVDTSNSTGSPETLAFLDSPYGVKTGGSQTAIQATGIASRGSTAGLKSGIQSSMLTTTEPTEVSGASSADISCVGDSKIHSLIEIEPIAFRGVGLPDSNAC